MLCLFFFSYERVLHGVVCYVSVLKALVRFNKKTEQFKLNLFLGFIIEVGCWE